MSPLREKFHWGTETRVYSRGSAKVHQLYKSISSTLTKFLPIVQASANQLQTLNWNWLLTFFDFFSGSVAPSSVGLSLFSLPAVSLSSFSISVMSMSSAAIKWQCIKIKGTVLFSLRFSKLSCSMSRTGGPRSEQSSSNFSSLIFKCSLHAFYMVDSSVMFLDGTPTETRAHTAI